MLVKSITEEEIYGIGHAFGYYDYGGETGMAAAFSGKEATANYICAYVCGVLRGGFLHTTSERSGASLQDRMDKEKKPYILLALANTVIYRSCCTLSSCFLFTATRVPWGPAFRRRSR